METHEILGARRPGVSGKRDRIRGSQEGWIRSQASTRLARQLPSTLSDDGGGWHAQTIRPAENSERALLLEISQLPGIEVGLFEITSIQLEKAIIDANFSIRHSFLTTGFHDYGSQSQGGDSKVSHPIRVLTREGLVESTISLYRPQTKLGDPRFWISRLGQIHPHMKPGDLVAVVQDGSNCAAVCLSDVARTSSGIREIGDHFGLAPSRASTVAVELLAKLRTLALHGPLPAVRSGDTAVGLSVETALGIKANSRQAPDYKGIELKSGRSLRGDKNKTLLAMVPDWGASPMSSYSELLYQYGYTKDDGLKYLQCSVTGLRPNPQGLSLAIDLSAGRLVESYSTVHASSPILYWDLDNLQQRVAKKHAETFWIEAEEVPDGFKLKRVIHTAAPRLSSLAMFLSDGTIFVDHTIRQKASGGTRDHGMLFRIKARDLRQLFTVEGNYLL
jgi:hypothetical protein